MSNGAGYILKAVTPDYEEGLCVGCWNVSVLSASQPAAIAADEAPPSPRVQGALPGKSVSMCCTRAFFLLLSCTLDG